MPSRFWEKMLLYLGLIEEEERYDEGEFEVAEAEANRKQFGGKRDKTVVSLHKTSKYKVVIVKPESYAEVEEAAAHLKDSNPVVVNLENADMENARRIIDFLSGTIFALSGSLRKVGGKVFIFTPPNIDLGGDQPEEWIEDALQMSEVRKES